MSDNVHISTGHVSRAYNRQVAAPKSVVIVIKHVLVISFLFLRYFVGVH